MSVPINRLGKSRVPTVQDQRYLDPRVTRQEPTEAEVLAVAMAINGPCMDIPQGRYSLGEVRAARWRLLSPTEQAYAIRSAKAAMAQVLSGNKLNGWGTITAVGIDGLFPNG